MPELKSTPSLISVATQKNEPTLTIQITRAHTGWAVVAGTRWERGSTSGLGPAEAGAAAPGPRDVAVEVAAAAAAELEKVLERVWSGGGGTVGDFAQALARTRDSAAAFRDAAAAEMRQAAARHRDMACFRSRLESPSPGGVGYG